MTKEQLQPFLMLDSIEFWLNSVNPINCDSLFVKSEVTDFKQALLFQDTVGGGIIKVLLSSYYLVKGEYVIISFKAMVVTNRRLFAYYNRTLKSVAVANIIRQEYKSNYLIIEYHENGVTQKLRFQTTSIIADKIINAIAGHQADFLHPQELELLLYPINIINNGSNFKNAFANQSASYKSISNAKEYQRKGNRNGLILFLVLVLLVGGFMYYVSSWSKSYEQSGKAFLGTSPSDGAHYNSVTGKKQHKCPWCGGIGRVGYAGESEAQVERTGNGLGNPCITCNGTGWVDDDN